jgi:hypothetical protein
MTGVVFESAQGLCILLMSAIASVLVQLSLQLVLLHFPSVRSLCEGERQRMIYVCS